jgi:hypothetical protein
MLRSAHTVCLCVLCGSQNKQNFLWDFHKIRYKFFTEMWLAGTAFYDSHTRRRGENRFWSVVPIFLIKLYEMEYKYAQAMPLCNCEFRENRRSTALRGTVNSYTLVTHFLSGPTAVRCKRWSRNALQSWWVPWTSVQWTPPHFIRVVREFCALCRHLCWDLDDVWYKAAASSFINSLI